jgi:hypothetical protein
MNAGTCDGDTVETAVDSVGDRVGGGLGREVVSVEGGDVDDGDVIGWNVGGDIGATGRNVGDIGRSVGGDSGDTGRNVGGSTRDIGRDVDTGGDTGLDTGTGAVAGGETGLATGTGAVTGAVAGGETGLATGTGAVTGGETGLATGTGIDTGSETGLDTGLATGFDAIMVILSGVRCCSRFRPVTASWTKSLSCGLSGCRSLKKWLFVVSL